MGFLKKNYVLEKHKYKKFHLFLCQIKPILEKRERNLCKKIRTIKLFFSL